ncbi:MAG: hypothetical protein HWN66_08255, partial [Candidatus Helarchaeota archaeon]|nr:hypothetical protein [Candidatus Helarchaeota archaeon]
MYAKNKGNEKIPEFKQFFPQGQNYEFYDFSSRNKYSKCDVPAQGVKYIGQNIRKPLYALFAEIDVQIDPKYCFVYYRRKGYFGFVPINPVQLVLLANYNENFYDAWLNEQIFDPFALVGFKVFQKGVIRLGPYFKRFTKIFKTKPEDPMLAINPLLEKANKSLNKI